MAKRKMSTFERLESGRLNRKQRRELERRVAAADPGLTIVHGNAGGIDVGNESHYVAVAPDRDPNPVREFGCWTAALNEMAEWLKSCRIDTVAMQATGVYWIALYDVLEQHGIRAVLVNAQHTSNVPGRKTDVQECQWLMKLHTYGLLRDSFRLAPEMENVRTIWRLRDRHVKEAGRAVHVGEFFHLHRAEAIHNPDGSRRFFFRPAREHEDTSTPHPLTISIRLAHFTARAVFQRAQPALKTATAVNQPAPHR
jgi:transposase